MPGPAEAAIRRTAINLVSSGLVTAALVATVLQKSQSQQQAPAIKAEEQKPAQPKTHTEKAQGREVRAAYPFFH